LLLNSLALLIACNVGYCSSNNAIDLPRGDTFDGCEAGVVFTLLTVGVDLFAFDCVAVSAALVAPLDVGFVTRRLARHTEQLCAASSFSLVHAAHFHLLLVLVAAVLFVASVLAGVVVGFNPPNVNPDFGLSTTRFERQALQEVALASFSVVHAAHFHLSDAVVVDDDDDVAAVVLGFNPPNLNPDFGLSTTRFERHALHEVALASFSVVQAAHFHLSDDDDDVAAAVLGFKPPNEKPDDVFGLFTTRFVQHSLHCVASLLLSVPHAAHAHCDASLLDDAGVAALGVDDIDVLPAAPNENAGFFASVAALSVDAAPNTNFGVAFDVSLLVSLFASSLLLVDAPNLNTGAAFFAGSFFAGSASVDLPNTNGVGVFFAAPASLGLLAPNENVGGFFVSLAALSPLAPPNVNFFGSTGALAALSSLLLTPNLNGVDFA